jgi:hypothetical protein
MNGAATPISLAPDARLARVTMHPAGFTVGQ